MSNPRVAAAGDWGIGYKEVYRIRDGGLVSLQDIARTEVGLQYLVKEKISPPSELGPLFCWSSLDFVEKRPGTEVWKVEYQRSYLCDVVFHQILLKYLTREQTVNYWDNMRRLGTDRRYNYWAEKKAGLMPRPYGSILADAVILKEMVL